MMKKLLCSLILIITTVGFVQAQQDINLQGNAVTIIDGDTTPDLGDHTDFDNVTVGSSLTRTFTIQNVGAGNLNLTSIGKSLSSDSQFTVDFSGVTTPVVNGSPTTFTVTFTPTVAGLATGGIVIVSDSPAPEDQYTFSIQATGVLVAQPDINVQGNSVDIADGDITPDLADHTDFDQVAVGSSFTRTFTIQNTGGADLNLTSVSTGLGNDPQFTVDASSTGTPVVNGTPTTFTVTFLATTAGSAVGKIVIASDDPDAESSYTFDVSAVAIDAQDINVQGNGIDIVDGDTTPDVADHTDFEQVTIGSSLTRTFTIMNTGNLDLNLSGVNLSLGSNVQFTIDNTTVGTPVVNGTPTTFTVTFTPTVVGVVTGGVVITSDDPDAEATYTFSIQAEGIAIIEPDINVQGNGVDIADGDTTPDLADDTDFDQVSVGSSLTRTFTIMNTGNANLNISGVSLSLGSNSQFTLDNTSVGTPVINGTPTTFTVTFTPTVVGIVTGGVVITSDDPDAESTYTFSIQANGIIATEPEMDVFGNGIEIADGDNTPDVADDTNFGQTDLTSGSIAHTFTIENNGGADLDLDGAPIVDIIGANPTDFTVSINPTTPIAAAGSTTFTIIFNPSALGIRNATVSIENNDSDEDPYTFDIQGEGIDANTDSPLLITQYYEGTGANDNWIEVKNISQTATVTNAYHLALYEDLEGTTTGFISSSSPTESIAIPALNAGAVVIFRRSGASLTNLGTASIVDTEVCKFDGNDIILISTSNGSNTYNDRIDIMGVVGGTSAVTWGVDTSLIKGCGTTEVSATVYDASQYIILALTEVDNATANTNLQLGTQTVGPTIWTSSWDNSIPDKTKNAIISGTYNGSNGSFEACNLTVNGGATINLNSGDNYILVEENLTVNGSFIIGDTEALITVNPDAIMTGSIQKNEITTTLNNFRDFTYWSSPVNTTIEQAFSGVSSHRIFKWDIPTTTPDFWGDWSLASGTMTPARGYISEAPSSTPDGGTHSVTFTGTPNNGSIGIIVGHNDDPGLGDLGDSDFNLIGNPYPSAINIDDFISSVSNNDIDGTIWLWTHNTAIDTGSGQFIGFDYATYNLTGGTVTASPAPSGGSAPTSNIGSGQAFFVKSVSVGPVFFENSMRLQGQNTQFFRAPDPKNTPIQEKDRVWLNVESNTGGAFSQILVGFFDTATDGHDRGYDGTRLGGGWIDFYSKIDTDHYAIQGLHTFNIDKEVQIGFDTYISDAMTYKISIDNIEGALNDNDIYLVDHELNTVHDLKLADYEFDVNGEGNFPDRFTLQFTSSVLGIDDVELTNNFVVINEENTLRLRSTTIITHLKVYDMMGRLLIDKKPNDSEFTINTHSIRKGTVLILNATFDNGAEVSKKAIKY